MTPLRRKLIEAEVLAATHLQVLSTADQALVCVILANETGHARPVCTPEQERAIDTAIAAMTKARNA